MLHTWQWFTRFPKVTTAKSRHQIGKAQ